MKILIAEDERVIARAIKEGLQQETYVVDVVHDGDDACTALLQDEYDMAILDVMMPEMNGYEVCAAVRQKGGTVPILLLTAKDQPHDIVRGLDSGADDYLAKPFEFDVLLARVRALLRRPSAVQGVTLQAHDLTMDTATKTVTRAGTAVQLSSKEYALLEYLLRHKNQVVSKNSIITHVWDFDADILPNTVEVFIAYLRAKIDKPFAGPKLIKTVRGFGYKVQDAA